MTKEELSLLLFLETCAVDYGGKVGGARMNAYDFEIAGRWNKSGYISFGRIKASAIVRYKSAGATTHWVVLSDQAFTDAHKERRARADRMLENRTAQYLRFKKP